MKSKYEDIRSDFVDQYAEKKENSFYTEKGTRKPLILADEVEVGELWATFMVSGMRFGVSVLQLQT